MSHPKIAVIGTGTVGSQVLWQLSKLGVEPVGYEIFSPGHPRGAAGGESRLFRFIELEDMRYLPMVRRADTLWKELEAESGRRLRNLGGALTIAREGSAAAETVRESVTALADRARILPHAQLRAEFPEFHVDEDEFGALDLDAGTIFPEKAVQTASAAAVARGAVLRTGSRVRSVAQRQDSVVVTANGQEESFDHVVVAAGAWTSTLLPALAPYLAPRRLLSTWFFPKPGLDLAGLMPYIRADPTYSYGLPTADGSAMKLGQGFSHHQPIDTPDTADLRVTEEDLSSARELAASLFPTLDSYPMRINPYFEAYTRSRIEFVGSHPDMDRVTVMAGFSGKGFKTSPALGEMGARLALGQPLSPETRFIHQAVPVAF